MFKVSFLLNLSPVPEPLKFGVVFDFERGSTTVELF